MFRRKINPEAELRMLEPRNADELFALIDANRARLRQWLPWVDNTRKVEDSRLFIMQGLERFEQNGCLDAGIWYKSRLAGVIGLMVHSDGKSDIGYWLGEEFEGKGLVTIACRALLRHVFEDLELNRVEIKVATGNTRSHSIPRRLGFTHEGVLRQDGWLYDHYVDHDVFSLLRSEWLLQQNDERKGR